MSVEASELTSEVWTRWQGHVINGVYPLGRYLGNSDHSVVFLTRHVARPSEVAIKLVPTNRALAESQLPRWKRAGGLAHPHLLRLLEWGGCQLDGLPYLYTVMEYADQTLAQLLLHRALTDDEAHEMLPPILDALAFLHGRNLVQGPLKPTNILVVGDQLKLASDTVRRVSEGPMNAPTVYDPPEARQGISSASGDIWALGVTLFEALTRRAPSSLGEPRQLVLPDDFSPAFRDIVVRCLNPTAQERPNATDLAAWAQGLATPEVAAPELTAAEATARPPATLEPSAFEPGTPQSGALEPSPPERLPEPSPPEPRAHTATPPVAAKPERSAASNARHPKQRALLMLILGALAILVLGWFVVRALNAHRKPAPALSAVRAEGAPAPATPGAATPAPAGARMPVSALATASATRNDVAKSPSALHEVMPDVPKNARRTIRGHVRVWVRVIVDQDGSVFAAATDRTGPSRYFERLAIDAAKKWTFPPVDAPPRRIVQVRFDFSRDGITGHAVALH